MAINDGTLMFEWDDCSDIETGYTLYIGHSSGIYDQIVDAGPSTFATVSGFENGIKHYATVTAYRDVCTGVVSLTSDEPKMVHLESEKSPELWFIYDSDVLNQTPSVRVGRIEYAGANSSITFRLVGFLISNQPIYLQKSYDLKNWQYLQTIYWYGSSIKVIDPGIPYSRRTFYKATSIIPNLTAVIELPTSTTMTTPLVTTTPNPSTTPTSTPDVTTPDPNTTGTSPHPTATTPEPYPPTTPTSTTITTPPGPTTTTGTTPYPNGFQVVITEEFLQMLKQEITNKVYEVLVEHLYYRLP
jgi:hypothetical protein